MDDLQEAAQTITKMSPPMLIIVGAAVLNFILSPFLPEKYLVLISTIGGGAVAPYVFSPSTIAYEVPSPGTALVLIGLIMGFVGSVIHRRLGRWFRTKVVGANGDTDHITRSGAGLSQHDPPANPHAQRKMNGS